MLIYLFRREKNTIIRHHSVVTYRTQIQTKDEKEALDIFEHLDYDDNTSEEIDSQFYHEFVQIEEIKHDEEGPARRISTGDVSTS
jgi:hypothetical protein